MSAFAAEADGNAQAQHPLIATHDSQISLRLTLGEISKAHLDQLRAAGNGVLDHYERTFVDFNPEVDLRVAFFFAQRNVAICASVLR